MSPEISTGWHKHQMSFICLSINWFGVLWVAMLQVFICRKIFKIQNAVFHIFPKSSSELDWSLSRAYSDPRALYLTPLTWLLLFLLQSMKLLPNLDPKLRSIVVQVTVTYPHLLQWLGQHVATLLLVDKDDNRRLEAVRQNLQQLLPARAHYTKHLESWSKWNFWCLKLMLASVSPLLSLRHKQDLLFDSLVRLSSRPDVHHSRTSQVAPGQSLHSGRHGSCEHDRLYGAIRHTISENTQQIIMWYLQKIPTAKERPTCLYFCFPDSKFIVIFSGSSASSVSGFWLVTGMYSRIFWTSGSKPMSIIRSASSRTT